MIVRAGARPVFGDVDPVTLCLDPDGRRGRGHAADARDHARALRGAPLRPGRRSRRSATSTACALVEDAAHATETRAADGRKVGSVGDITCFSFYANKNLAAGEGGMLTLRDDELADAHHARCACTASRATPGSATRRRGPGAYDVLEPGYKLNLSDLHAGVALGQLHRIEEHHARRVAQAERYDEGLAGLEGITPLGRRLGPRGVHGWHIYVVRIDPATRPAPTATRTRRRSARRGSARACTSCRCTS